MSIKRRLRAIALAIVLLAGATSGVAMRREDIEQLLCAHNQVEIHQTIRKDDDDSDEQKQLQQIDEK